METMMHAPWNAAINLQAELSNGNGAHNHLAMITARAEADGRITVRTEQDGAPATTVSGYGERPTIRLADGAIVIVLPPVDDH